MKVFLKFSTKNHQPKASCECLPLSSDGMQLVLVFYVKQCLGDPRSANAMITPMKLKEFKSHSIKTLFLFVLLSTSSHWLFVSKGLPSWCCQSARSCKGAFHCKRTKSLVRSWENLFFLFFLTFTQKKDSSLIQGRQHYRSRGEWHWTSQRNRSTSKGWPMRLLPHSHSPSNFRDGSRCRRRNHPLQDSRLLRCMDRSKGWQDREGKEASSSRRCSRYPLAIACTALGSQPCSSHRGEPQDQVWPQGWQSHSRLKKGAIVCEEES